MLFGFLVCFSFVANLSRVVLMQAMAGLHCSSLPILQLPLNTVWKKPRPPEVTLALQVTPVSSFHVFFPVSMHPKEPCASVSHCPP